MTAHKVELREKRGAMFETQPRFDVILNGSRVGELYFNTRGYVGRLPTHTGQSLEILVNDAPVLSTRLVKPDDNRLNIQLPAEVQQSVERQGVLNIRLRYANAISPGELGLSKDPRKLAIGIQALTLN